MNRAARIVAVAMGMGVGTWVHAQEDRAASSGLRTPDLSFARSRQPPEPAEPPSPAIPEKPAATRFGAAHSRWWTVGGGLAHDLIETTDLQLRGGYSYFLAQDIEFGADLYGWYFNQAGDDAWGVNPSIVYRWHFFDDGTWTIFADVGIGLLVATDEVPDGGTSFDFTPGGGVGFTRLLDADTGLRLQGGLRWHHISNARIQGTADNPGRDGLLFYAGLQFPF